jgi:D-serine deaminase-like pyridoxal phosphate-dependent protein
MHAFFNRIDTPSLIIEKSTWENNIQKMQNIANKNNIALRPHIKTHKMPDLVRKQIEVGARGIACAKIGEAEIMNENGIDDIQIANVVSGQSKLRRLKELNNKTDHLSVCVDSYEAASELSRRFSSATKPINVLIEIDTGFHRCGIEDFDEAADLALKIIALPGLVFEGIMTHAGHAYAAESPEQVRRIGFQEGQFMSALKNHLSSLSVDCPVVSVGSTPTAPWCGRADEITELRAGNYIFYDMIQVMLGSCSTNDCALNILATVISVPSANRAVIDAGSKALGLDLGGHGNATLSGHGNIRDKNAEITRLSEEHGVITHEGESFSYGERLRIVPNHACAVVNLYDHAWIVDGMEIIEKIEIKARGKMT